MPVNSMVGYDSQDDMLKVKSVQKKMRDSFGGTEIDASKWELSLGSGGSSTVAGGVLTLASGITANSQSSLLSKETFTIPFRVTTAFTMSQRIANQSFYVEAVSVSPETGLPDGKESIGYLFDGTTPTQGKYLVQTAGGTPLVSGLVTLPTTVSGSVFELEPFSDEAWFHGGVLDSTNGRANSYRRHQQIPDPNGVYKIRVRWLNGATAPASSTNAVVQFIAVQDYAELTAEITAGRGQTVAGQALAAAVVSMPTVTVTGTVNNIPSPSTSSGGFTSLGKLIAAATTNPTLLKGSAGNLGLLSMVNLSASTKYLKIFNKATAPVPGTDVPTMVYPVLANSHFNVPIPSGGLRFGTGLGVCVTGGIADTDTTALAANDVVVDWAFI